MNPEELQKNIALYYSKLPKEAQEVFAKMDWLERLKSLTAMYGLTGQQQEILGTETTLILLGMINQGEYEATLTNEMGLKPDLIDKILVEINNGILKPIAPQLTATYQKNNVENVPIDTDRGGIEEKLDERFKKLPQNIQNAIGQSNYQTALYDIYKEYKLTIEQVGMLEDTLIEVMLTNISAGEFEREIRNKLRLDDDKTKDLIVAINEKIIKKVRQNMAASAPAQIQDEEMKVLDSAGISIIEPWKKEAPAPSAPMEVKPAQVVKEVKEIKPNLSIPELPVGDVPAPTPAAMTAPAPSILKQKFSDTFQIPTVTTQHGESEPVIPDRNSYPKGTDPYRISPEE
ncbi:MAG: hypothetical protein V4486_00190 [Patescibacteria group bacterium]